MLKAVDQFLVYDPEDRFHSSLCYGEAEARKIVSDFGCTAGLIVLRITKGDICRDVTADFLEDEEPLPPDDESDWDYYDGSLQEPERPHLVTSTRGHSYVRDGGV